LGAAVYKILSCISGEHDLRLVLLAVLVCLASAATTVAAYRRARRSFGRLRLAWIAFTGFVGGAGVWATHFVAMLAYQPSLPIQYAPGLTLLSFVAAAAGIAVGLGVAARGATWAGLIGGMIAGLSVGAMHFIGMAGVRAQVDMMWDAGLVTAALAVGAAGFAAAVMSARLAKTLAGSALAAGILLMAIVGLHFTAMGAVTLAPDPSVVLPPELVGRPGLTAAAVAISLVILLSAGAVLLVERYSSRATLENLREALDSTPTALAFFDGAARLIFWNEGYRRFLADFDITPAHGLPFRHVVSAALATDRYEPQATDGATRSAWLEFDRSGPDQRLSQEMALKDGRWFLCQANNTPGGGLVVVISDITQQRAAQTALAEAATKAEAASLAKTRFVANISHEIRTPLNGILGLAQVMERDARDSQAIDRLGMIRDCGASLMGILNDLLDIARIESGKMEVERRPFDLVETVEASCGAFVSMAAQKGVAFAIELDPALAGLRRGDPVRLRQILANLASNAVKFTETGAIRVSAVPCPTGVAFAVEDSGVGIPAERLPDLFNRFAQLDASATRRHSGTGLGLALCRELAELMGGRIWAESTPGVGSTFRFELPLEPALEAEADADVPAPEPAEAQPRAIRVLAAEDNPTNRYLLQALFDRTGVELTVVENGQAAVEALAADAFDLVLMDVQMPVLDGVAATRAIRAGGARVPIIALSANVMEFQKAEYLDAGMNAIVPKPIEARTLLAAMDQCLSDAA
jgi:signal transduction histidine kinase/NO-binding membrane sensor protein with MHYT domain